MKEFISQYCHRNDDRINRDMFTRAYDRPLVEYILDTCKNLEVIPAIKLVGWEYITDQTKIRSEVNKKNAKDPKIKNNKTLERLAQPNRTLYDLLVLHFRITAKGRTQDVTRRVKILKQLKDGSYLRNGKKVLLLNQVVDNSTYVKGNELNFKTTLYPIKLSTIKTKIHFTDDETPPVACPCYRLDLLSKVTNPLLYYLAQYGIDGTLEKFDMNTIMSVVDEPLDDDKYLYVKIKPKVYVEVHEKAFYAHPFVPKFVATLVDVLAADKTNFDLKDVYDKQYWLGRLAEVFSKKRNPEKGERVLISFSKVWDPSSRKKLSLRKFHKESTFTIIRWMMTNYDELLTKDSNDLKFKRVRANEVLAYFFDNYITRNVYSLLNTDNPSFDKYVRLLNSISENTLIRATQSGGKSSPTSMFRYERYNDLDAIDLSRYTLKGPTGLNGGKKKTSMRYRDIHVSQLGRYDLNVCSSSDPGLTGYLSANVKLDDTGHFDVEKNEPDSYDATITPAIAKFGGQEYVKSRQQYIRLQLSRTSDGFMHLKRKYHGRALIAEFNRDPDKYGLYRHDGFLRIKPKVTARNPKGFITLVHKKQSEADKLYRDENGFIRLRRVSTKLDRQKK